MQSMAFHRIIAPPKNLTAVCVDAKNAALMIVGMVAHEIEPLPP
jgi:hypothetical protein